MIDNEFINRVCNIDIDYLKNVNVDKVKFDTANPFIKYYDLAIITKAIDLYKIKYNKKDLELFFSSYNLVLSGGFKDNVNDSQNEVVDLMINEIFWVLDELSFLNDDIDMTYYKNKLSILDNVIKNDKKWVVYYSIDEDEKQVIILVNDAENIYFEIESYFYMEEEKTDRLFYLSVKEIQNKKKLLVMKNYKNLEY